MKNLEHLTFSPINISGILQTMHHPESGGLVLFSGEARKFHMGKEVVKLEYEAYEKKANDQIREILEIAIKKWQLNKAICVHRLGEVKISESAVLIITSSEHRSEAYESNQWIINSLKKNVFIWKKEVYTDGTTFWVPGCNHSFIKN